MMVYIYTDKEFGEHQLRMRGAAPMKILRNSELSCMQRIPFQHIPLLRVAAFMIAFLSLANPIPVTAENDTAQTDSQASHQEEIVDITYPDWFKTSFMELEEDILEAQEVGKRLMLVFHQPGCPYCNALVEQNLSQKDIEETVKSNFDVIEINMWGDLEVVNVDGVEFTEKTFAEYLKVQFTPTVLMYHSDGSIAMRINGYFPPDKFRASLEYVINEDTDAKSFNEYLADVNPEILDASAQRAQIPAKYDYIKSDDMSTEQTIVLPGGDTDTPYLILFEQRDCSTPDGNELTGRDFAKRLGINYAPTMVAYSSNHEEVIRSESWIRRFHTRTIFEYVLTEAWKEQPSFQRFIRERADEIRESGGSVSILD